MCNVNKNMITNYYNLVTININQKLCTDREIEVVICFEMSGKI